jgi:hypothetical protein
MKWGGFQMFRCAQQDLLNIEQDCQKKCNKIKTNVFRFALGIPRKLSISGV